MASLTAVMIIMTMRGVAFRPGFVTPKTEKHWKYAGQLEAATYSAHMYVHPG